MNPGAFTRKLISESNEITIELLRIVTPLGEDLINKIPAEGKWSVGQVIDHVNKSNIFYLIEIEKILNEKRLKPDAGRNVKTGMLGSFALKAIEPGNKKKHKSHKLFTPSQQISKENVIAEFVRIQNRLSAYLDILSEFDLNSARVSSPANRLIRFRLGDFLALIVTHEKRHLQQVKNTLVALKAIESVN